MADSTHTLYIDILETPLAKGDTVRCIQQSADALFTEISPTRAPAKPFALSIRMDSNAVVRSLNAEFRNKDKPTNVLSFPTSDEDAWDDEEQLYYLGDIIIAADILADEAKRDQKEIVDHLQHLTIHGILHLLGFDHILDKEAEVMENIEIRTLMKLGVKNPYND